INDVHSWERVEDDLPPLRRLVIHAGGQGDRAEGDLRPTGWPRRARVGDIIAGLGHLDEDAELDGFLCWPRAEFVEEKVGGLGCRRFVGEVLGPGVGPDAKAPVAADAAGVGELKGGAGKEGFARETGGDGLWGFHEPFRVRVACQECSDRFRLAGPGSSGGAQKLKELLTGADRKAVKGMGDNVRVQVLVEMEADGDPSGAGTRG